MSALTTRRTRSRSTLGRRSRSTTATRPNSLASFPVQLALEHTVHDGNVDQLGLAMQLGQDLARFRRQWIRRKACAANVLCVPNSQPRAPMRRRRMKPTRPSASRAKPLLLAPPGIEKEQLVEVVGLLVPLASLVAPRSGVVGTEAPAEVAPPLSLDVGLPV